VGALEATANRDSRGAAPSGPLIYGFSIPQHNHAAFFTGERRNGVWDVWVHLSGSMPKTEIGAREVSLMETSELAWIQASGKAKKNGTKISPLLRNFRAAATRVGVTPG
jgi:hypothetical protein